jgi:hypothetical protein
VAGAPRKTDLFAGVLSRTHGPGGAVFFQENRTLKIQPVKEFVPEQAVAPPRFSAIARLFALASGKKIDFVVLRDHFRSLFEQVFGRPFSDALSKQAAADPKRVAARWLIPLFNQAIQAARLVMWQPPGKRSQNLTPAIYCPDLETALLVGLLLSRGGGMTACLGCGVLFVPRRPNQAYHDHLCANRHRKRRERQTRGKRVRNE